LRYFVEAYPDHQLKEITAKYIEQYIYHKIHKGEKLIINMEGVRYTTNKINKWTAPTVKAARGYFTAFFTWCIAQGYIAENPCKKVDSRKVRSEAVAEERHIPFTQEDLKTILNYLDANDTYTALFCRVIYYTCLRPSEIVSLKLSHVNLTAKAITVPMHGMKNTVKTTADMVNIDASLLDLLHALDLSNYPSDYYLFSNNYSNVVGEATVGHNRPYKRFIKALKALKLDGKGYTLYSFKHTSNINRKIAGWDNVQIMKANRHSSIAMSERYMKNITRTTDISKLTVPAI
jgi:integrase